MKKLINIICLSIVSASFASAAEKELTFTCHQADKTVETSKKVILQHDPEVVSFFILRIYPDHLSTQAEYKSELIMGVDPKVRGKLKFEKSGSSDLITVILPPETEQSKNGEPVTVPGTILTDLLSGDLVCSMEDAELIVD